MSKEDREFLEQLEADLSLEGMLIREADVRRALLLLIRKALV